MRYLCRLVTPPGGTVLDVFAGSGTTGVAALAEGLTFVGAELGGDSGEHLPALVGRIWRALGMPGTPPAIPA
jgi:site-specific DNA-methyltransferase (adenine-specific)